MRKIILGLMALVAGSAASAQSVKSTVQTSLGVTVTKWSDEFADRYEFASPDVPVTIERGVFNPSASVSLVKKAGVAGPTKILVVVSYSGEWQFYNSAIFKGGEQIAFEEGPRNVLGCSGGCRETEAFFVVPTAAQLAKYGADGNLTFQIRSKTATASIITIPMSYIAAVQEAAKQ